jgi:hypothetical protein
MLMNPHHPSDWQHVSEPASDEVDPNKLTNLVIELNRLLGQRAETSRRKPSN